MNVSEFKRWCEGTPYTSIVYHSQNNAPAIRGYDRFDTSRDSLYMEMSFDRIAVGCNSFGHPNGSAVIECSSGKVCFRNIHRVEITTHLLGYIVTLYCDSGKRREAHTLLIAPDMDSETWASTYKQIQIQ